MLRQFFFAFAFVLTTAVSFAQQVTGTAFAIAPGLLITNQHVIDGCGDIDLIAPDGRRPAELVDSVQQIDLALLRVYGLRGGIASLRFSNAVQLGEPITVFGFPLSGSLSSTGNFTSGIVSSLRGFKDAAGEIQITAPIQPGNSGGPVLDSSGAVIGVVVSGLAARRTSQNSIQVPQNVNFAIAPDVLADFLKKNKVELPDIQQAAALNTTEIAKLAQGFTYRVECTLKSMKQVVASPVAPAVDPTFVALVKAIQVELARLGYGVGGADGVYGQKTQTALKDRQRYYGLKEDGLPTEQLLDRLKKDQSRVALEGSANSSVKERTSDDWTNHLKKMRALVRSKMYYPFRTPPFPLPTGSPSRPVAVYRIEFEPSGVVRSLALFRSSGASIVDENIEAGLSRANFYEIRPPGGTYPKFMDFSYGLYDDD